jgi:hypothetical protein
MRKLAIPPIFQRKIVLDSLVKTCSSRSVVDFADYKRLKKEQREAFRECEKVYFPSKKG